MNASRRILPLFVGLALLSACNSDSTGTAADSDHDGIADVDDPNPNGATFNRLNGTFTGGDASVVAITWYDGNGDEDTDGAYETLLTEDCSQSWYPQGTLCDESPTTDDPDVSTKTTQHSGATWGGNGAELGTGVLVVDACETGGCAAVDVNEGRVFQMFSDGKTTHIRFYAHPEMGDTPPAWDDPAWRPLGDFAVVDSAETVGAATTVDMPTVVSLTPTVSRYFRIDAQNDGRYGDPDYIELRSVKMFAVALP